MAAIDAAVRAGASRVHYTSHQAASPDSLFDPGRQHASTERHLAYQGVAYTALRHGFYTSTLEHYVPAALQTGEFRLPEDGPFSWTAHADLVEADVLSLTRPGALDGLTPPLTAPDLLDFADVARVLGELTGRDIKRVVVDDEEWKETVVAQGIAGRGRRVHARHVPRGAGRSVRGHRPGAGEPARTTGHSGACRAGGRRAPPALTVTGRSCPGRGRGWRRDRTRGRPSAAGRARCPGHPA